MDPNQPESSRRQLGLVPRVAPTPAPQQPRQPRNLQGLLRFAMEATKAEDAPYESTVSPMDEDRRRFLEEALGSMTVNIGQILRDAIQTLSDTETMQSIRLEDTLPAEVETAFNNLHEFIEDIDIANDFSKMGGFAIFPACYGSESERVRSAASVVLGELCQNNPYCQQRALELGLVNVLLKLIETEQGTTLKKCLFALSCAVREYEPACRELIAQGGCGTLARILGTAAPGPAARAAFLATRLATVYPEARDQFIKENVVASVAHRLNEDRSEATEHLLGLLACLIESKDPQLLSQMRDPSLGLRNFLVKNVVQLEAAAESDFLEEKEHSLNLLKVCTTEGTDWRDDGSNEDGADR